MRIRDSQSGSSYVSKRRRRSDDGFPRELTFSCFRRIRFLEPMNAAILSNRRRVAPSGILGGGDALPGVNKVVRRDGDEEVLSATASAEMKTGDTFVIATPGGGGYGAP